MAKRRTTQRQRAASRRNLAKGHAARSRKKSLSLAEIRFAAIGAIVLFVGIVVLTLVTATHGLALLALVPIIGLVIFVRTRRRSQEARRRDAWIAYRLDQARRIESLMALTPREFEETIATLLVARGSTDVQVVGGAGDLAADIIGINRNGQRFVVQCKRYAQDRRVTSTDVQKLMALGIRHHGAESLAYFTTSDYTKPARDLADQHDYLQLFNGADIIWLADSASDLPEVDETQQPEAAWIPDGFAEASTEQQQLVDPATVPSINPSWDQQHWRVCVVCHGAKTRWRDDNGRAVCERCKELGPTTEYLR